MLARQTDIKREVAIMTNEQILRMIGEAKSAVVENATVGQQFMGSMNWADTKAPRHSIEWSYYETFYRQSMEDTVDQVVIDNDGHVVEVKPVTMSRSGEPLCRHCRKAQNQHVHNCDGPGSGFWYKDARLYCHGLTNVFEPMGSRR